MSMVRRVASPGAGPSEVEQRVADRYSPVMETLEVQRLAGSCGAIVRGIDVSRPQSPEEIETILQLLDEHLVVAFPDQAMDLDRLEAFTDELGGRDVTPYVKPVDGRPYVIRVIKEPGDELNFANAWHTDLSYLEAPPAYTVLHAHDVPDAGGDTMWANQYLAYETLPDSLKEQIADLRATHSAGFAYGTGGYLEAVAGKSSMAVEPSADAYAVETHPLVIRHPRTGRPALYANSVYTTGIEGMDHGEAASLLARLTAHATHPNFTCRLRWEPGMLTIWDNNATQHFAINDYPGERRELFRTSVKGAAPRAVTVGF
jgi:taurine dioxygenase